MTDDFDVVCVGDDALGLRLEAATVRRPDGASYRHHRLVVGAGGFVLVARHDDRVLFAWSERVAAGGRFLELPRGLAAEGEDVSSSPEGGLRELREETGWRGTDAVVVGTYVLDTSVYPQPVSVVVCRVDPTEAPAEADGEVDGLEWLAAADLDRAIREGVVRDGHSLAALAMWRARSEGRGASWAG